MFKKILAGVAVLLIVAIAYALIRNGQPPKDLWAVTGSFPICPDRPSCVSSASPGEDSVHGISPLGYPGPDVAGARAKIEEVIRAMPNAEIIMTTPEYLHVVFKSPALRLADDVELLVQPAIIQVRAISRFGYGDSGLNRERVEAIRAAFGAKYTS